MFESAEQLSELPAAHFTHVHRAHRILLLVYHLLVRSQLAVVPERHFTPVTLVGPDIEVNSSEVTS